MINRLKDEKKGSGGSGLSPAGTTSIEGVHVGSVSVHEANIYNSY
jgi:hypothetical protein